MENNILASHLALVDRYDESITVLHEHTGNYSWHSHDKGQLTYLAGGVNVLYTDGANYYVPERHYVWIPPYTKYKFRYHNQVHPARTWYIKVNSEFHNPFFWHIGVYPVDNMLLEILQFSVKWEGDVFPDNTAVYSFLKSTLLLLPSISKKLLPIALPVSRNERITRIVLYIESRLHTNMSLEDTANRFGHSGRTLNRIFKVHLKTSFFQYLKMARITKAMELLLTTDQNVSEVASSVGYESLSAFSNTFYQLIGQRPSSFQYRMREP